MCGIVGIYNLKAKPVDSFLIQRMTKVLEHRGPDDLGVFCYNQVALGHSRLSVIDLSKAGHQPMSNKEKTIWIVHNGEIYNFLELRKTLIELGYKFKSRTDTEVILYSYQEWGVNCLEKFDGMFAFAIWDKNKEQIFLARDRLGQKPLYYYNDSEKFIFASEIKAILEDNTIQRKVDSQGMTNYFTFGHSIAPDTMYRGIKKLLPGHYLVFKNKKIEIKQYWEPHFSGGEDKGKEYYQQGIRELFEKSVKRRLISDVPLGVFLSGGIDSSSIVAMMSKLGVFPIKTFSVGFNVKGRSEFNELSDAKIIANHFKTEHHELLLKESDLINTLNKLVYHFDEPFGDAANFPVFYISQFAKNYVDVVLTGDGGDEIFGGYRRYMIEKNRSKFLALSLPLKNNLIKKSLASSRFGKVKRIVATLPIKDDLLRYGNWLTFFSEEMRDQLFQKELLENKKNVLNAYEQHFSQNSSSDLLQNFMHLDQKILLPDRYLEKIDKSSMAMGLETRTPFLDHHLVKFANLIPSKYKIKGIKTKYIFKEAMKDFLPKQVLRKKEHGFSVPINPWFRGKLKDYLFEIIFDKKTRSRGYFNFDYIEKLYKNYQKGNQPFGPQLWLILNFELWHRRFIDVN